VMTRPTREQLGEMRAGQASVSGAHTVGARDGGPGIPATGWSREHGDLRVAHFLGLHALQVLPLSVLALRRTRASSVQRKRLAFTLAGSYAGLIGIVLGQALRGQALLAPDASTFAALFVWAALTAVLVRRALGGSAEQLATPPRLLERRDESMASHVFSIVNLIALAGWVLLAVLPHRRWPAELVSGWLLPALLAGTYVVIVAATWGRSPGGFSSLAAVSQLFTNPWMVLAGWVHYLAFDLFVGSWIVRDSRERGIAHLWVLPSLLLTFLFGPAGWLSYLGLRTALRPRAHRHG
jgi:hypothetical protein